MVRFRASSECRLVMDGQHSSRHKMLLMHLDGSPSVSTVFLFYHYLFIFGGGGGAYVHSQLCFGWLKIIAANTMYIQGRVL